MAVVIRTPLSTALQWLGLSVAGTVLLVAVGELNRAIWVLAGLCAVAVGYWTWQAMLSWVDERRDAHLDALYRATGQAAVDAMTGVEFEHYVAAVLRGARYEIDFTRATGDFGVDLIATRDGVRTAVQCKRQARPVSGSAIQQVVAGAPVHACTATMVVCNHRYTHAAEQLAEVHDCILIGRTQLARMARTRVRSR